MAAARQRAEVAALGGSVGAWLERALAPSSDRINPMLAGVYRQSKLTLAHRLASARLPPSEEDDFVYEEGDPRLRMHQERLNGQLPGSSQPQPFAPLLVGPAELGPGGVLGRNHGHGRRAAAASLGPRAHLTVGSCRRPCDRASPRRARALLTDARVCAQDEAALKRLEQVVARITRSGAFAQFALACEKRRGSTCTKELKLGSG